MLEHSAFNQAKCYRKTYLFSEIQLNPTYAGSILPVIDIFQPNLCHSSPLPLISVTFPHN